MEGSADNVTGSGGFLSLALSEAEWAGVRGYLGDLFAPERIHPIGGEVAPPGFVLGQEITA